MYLVAVYGGNLTVVISSFQWQESETTLASGFHLYSRELRARVL